MTDLTQSQPDNFHIGTWLDHKVAEGYLPEYPGARLIVLYDPQQTVTDDDEELERLRETDKQFGEVWNWLVKRDLADPRDDSGEWPESAPRTYARLTRELLSALAAHKYPVSDAAEPSLMEGGSREAKRLHFAATLSGGE